MVQNSNTSTLGGGGISPIIDTKSTVRGSVTEYSAMIAQNRELTTALANLQANPTVTATAGAGGKVPEIFKH